MESPQNSILADHIEEKTALVELLIERATDYGKTRIGEVLGKPYYGSFVVAGAYALIGMFVAVFLHRRLKRMISNFIIFKVLQ